VKYPILKIFSDLRDQMYGLAYALMSGILNNLWPSWSATFIGTFAAAFHGLFEFVRVTKLRIQNRIRLFLKDRTRLSANQPAMVE